MGIDLHHYVRQTRALTKKNLLGIVVRRPINFILRAYFLPIAFLVVLVNFPRYLYNSGRYGIGTPARLQSLADALQGTEKFIIIQRAEAGPDIQRVVEEITRPLNRDLVKVVDSEREALSSCPVNFRGISPCLAILNILDSPLTEASFGNRTWNYSIAADPSRQGYWTVDVNSHSSPEERVFFPVQLAMENAILNSTYAPEFFKFSQSTQEEQEKSIRTGSTFLLVYMMAFALFGSFMFMIYHIASEITQERASGMAQLIDTMGGNSPVRILSYIATFNIIYFPSWIIFGIAYWQCLWPTADVGIIIGWQLLLGLAVTSSAVFGSVFFTKARVSSIYVVGAFLLLAAAGQISLFQQPNMVSFTALGLLFPSSNYVYVILTIGYFTMADKPINLNDPPPLGNNWDSMDGIFTLNMARLFGFLAIQIVVYPVLAILVDTYMHGIVLRGRTFSTAVDETSPIVRTSGLSKVFSSYLSKSKTVAVDNVDIESYKGQILCLLGPNGSGKTTTLHMIAGFCSSTSGSVSINGAASQIGENHYPKR
jgi:ATP-binding cassette, subfamily A (ABC1), member 3